MCVMGGFINISMMSNYDVSKGQEYTYEAYEAQQFFFLLCVYMVPTS